MKEKTPLSHEVVRFKMPDFETSKSNSWGLQIKFVENYFFLKNRDVTSMGAVSHKVLYYQPLLITRYQVRFSRRFHKTLPNLRLIFGLRTSPNPAL